MRIAMIQMASASGDVERNISRAFSMMEEAAEKSDLLVLPELWTIGYNFHHFEEHILSRHALLLEKLSDFARTHRVTLSPGTLPIRHGAIIRNTGFLFAPDGKCIAEYSKRHLFQGYLEAKLFRPGDALMQTRIHGIQTGMAVCYEFYFPKMWRKMAKAGDDPRPRARFLAEEAYPPVVCPFRCPCHRERHLHLRRQYGRYL